MENLFLPDSGILIPDGLGSEGFEGMMKACKYARENKIPCLSIGHGFQCAVIEFAQNVLGIHANESYKKVLEVVNIKMLENGNPRMGARTITFLTKDSKLYKLYGSKPFIKERNWNRMEINPFFVPSYLSSGLRFVAIGFDENEDGEISDTLQNLMAIAQIHDESDEKDYIKTMKKLCKYSHETHTALRMQAMELKEHPYYVGIQYHAKFGLNPSMPSPSFIGLIQAASREKENFEATNVSSFSNDTVITTKDNDLKITKKDKSSAFAYYYYIKCKNPIEDGIFKISSLERFLKAKLNNLVNDVRADQFKIVITSEKNSQNIISNI
uniref:CTP synthase (glutamine hydrolyzing) n=1 Tax=Panagrolaimus superbus TaxID=310955 RepID=A0A914Y7Q2_9BILA